MLPMLEPIADQATFDEPIAEATADEPIAGIKHKCTKSNQFVTEATLKAITADEPVAEATAVLASSWATRLADPAPYLDEGATVEDDMLAQYESSTSFLGYCMSLLVPLK